MSKEEKSSNGMKGAEETFSTLPILIQETAEHCVKAGVPEMTWQGGITRQIKA